MLFQVGLLLLVVAVVIAFVGSGSHRAISPERIRTEILALGWLGPVVFVVGFALLQPIGPSGHIFAVGASLVWPPPLAFLLAWLGAVGAQIVGFSFYRFVARDFAQRRIPRFLSPYQARLEAQPFRTILIMRTLLFTWHPASLLLGVSNVRFGTMVAATAIGLVPTLVFDVWFLGGMLHLLGLP